MLATEHIILYMNQTSVMDFSQDLAQSNNKREDFKV